ncbi:MAG: hypothetical protein U0R52_11905 [Solirubrobacterales bacterium]
MNERASLILDTELLARAEQVLGTRGPTATVRQSLRETIRSRRLRSLTEWELPADFPERLSGMRTDRLLAR